MKIRLLSVAIIATLLASGCGKTNTASSATHASHDSIAAPAPASTLAVEPVAAQSGGARVIEITANDQMKFGVTAIEAKAGEELKVVLNNLGTLPKEAMGHNWVLLKAGTDVNAFATAAMTARDTNYIPAAQKDKVLASIPVLGPKQKADTTFKAPGPGTYTYICSFPGHYMLMKGTLTVK